MTSEHSPLQSKDGNSLIIKGIARIESINIHREDIRLPADLYTHAVSRIMRRDFNITSVKLFFFCMNVRRREYAQRSLYLMREEAEALTNLTRPYEMPRQPVLTSCTMRIITDEAQMLFDSLLTVDRALLKLMHSPMAEVALEQTIPFNVAYNALRKRIFDYEGREGSADQG